jgi:hypothetical protein
MRSAGDVAGMEELWWGKTKGKRPFGRPRRRWEDNIKMDLQRVGCRAWTGLLSLRGGHVAGSRECGNELSGSIKCGEILD